MFDPYHEWLGIPKEDQPPSLYRLLGLKDYEKDRNVIASAADRCQGLLESVPAGARRTLAEELMGHVANARKILLDRDTQASYDQALTHSQQPLSPDPPLLLAPLPGATKRLPLIPPPPRTVNGGDSTLPTDLAPPSHVSQRKESGKRRNPFLETTKIILGALIGIVLGGLILSYWFHINPFERFGMTPQEPSPAQPSPPE